MPGEDLIENIEYFTEKLNEDHHRYHSWEKCYEYFQDKVINNPDYNEDDGDYAALILGFYLTSWGMYRGSSRLLTEYTYTIHRDAIDIIRNNRDNLFNCYNGLVNYYSEKKISPTDTLISKIILGTLGLMPAYDRFFVEGIRQFNRQFNTNIKQSINFNREDTFNYDRNYLIDSFRKNVLDKQNIEYDNNIINDNRINEAILNEWSLAKFIDVYFWQLGKQALGNNEFED